MKIYRNLAEIERKEQRGRRISLIGLGILFLGLMANIMMTRVPTGEEAATPINQFLLNYGTWIIFATLPVGLLCALIGSYYVNRFARRKWTGTKTIARPDEVLERSLKGFDNKYAYFAWSLPAHYALVGPCGIIVIAARSDRGRVTVEGDKWREPFSIGRLLTVFAREGLGNPSGEVEEQANKLRALLASPGSTNGKPYTLDDMKVDLDGVPITGAAVFLNPAVSLTAENPSLPVMRADQFKEFVRRQARDTKMSAQTLRAVTDRLVEAAVYTEEE